MTTGRARSASEMQFAATLVPCPSCGTRALGKLDLYGNDELWSYACKCPSCGIQRVFSYPTVGAPYDKVPAAYELGDGPSTLISAQQFRDELAGALPQVILDPTQLQPREWHASRHALVRALTCMTELRKLGQPHVPDADRERLLELTKVYARDDEDRIFALERGR